MDIIYNPLILIKVHLRKNKQTNATQYNTADKPNKTTTTKSKYLY